jgi:low molecular weight protein-tyrosine phosphatase
MDGSNIADLEDIVPHAARGKVRRFLDYAPHLGIEDVPDPYYGGVEGFDHALDLIEAAAEGLLADLTQDTKAKKTEA